MTDTYEAAIEVRDSVNRVEDAMDRQTAEWVRLRSEIVVLREVLQAQAGFVDEVAECLKFGLRHGWGSGEEGSADAP